MASGWEGIEEFLAVYDRGSFSAAASQLGVSASHVSRAVAGLEIRLQARLFFRTTRRVTPTDTGRAFAERCRRMVEEREDAFAVIGEHGKPHGVLRITCSVAFGERYVAPLMRRFVEEHPQVSAVLDLDNRVRDIVTDGYDLAIRTGNLSDSRLVGTRIASRRLHLCAAPRYIERHGRPETVGDLAHHACVIGTSDVWHFQVDGKAVDLRPRGRWRCNSGFAVADAAVAGLGLCQLPDFYVTGHLQTGALMPLLENAAPPDEPVWAVYPHRQHLQPKVRLFIDLLRAGLADAQTRAAA